MTATWLLTLHDPDHGQRAFIKWLNHNNKEVRLMAAAALASAGRFGYPLTREAFKNSDDPYIKLNLALGLIAQREECRGACGVIYRTLMDQNERWMTERKGLFSYVAPEKGKQRFAAPDAPEEVNQLTRLEILNILAIMEDPNAQAAIRHFLKERTWGISGMASALLLTEGDEMALQYVEELLVDPEEKVRIQAGLILALWGKGESAINVLQESYGEAGRDMKERLLEAVGQIGARSSIPFLVERLKEPYPTLRIIAAASLLKCLYH